MESNYYTAPETAERLKVTVKTITRWCRNGKLKGAVLYLESRRKGWRIPAELVDHLASGGYFLKDASLQLPLQTEAIAS